MISKRSEGAWPKEFLCSALCPALLQHAQMPDGFRQMAALRRADTPKLLNASGNQHGLCLIYAQDNSVHVLSFIVVSNTTVVLVRVLLPL